jgi:FkbM family methyltransferase
LIKKAIEKILLYLKSIKFVKTSKINNQNIKINISTSIELWRARTYLTKEPETINWIDGFKKKEVFFDVGANIGLYSIYASKKKCKVYSFEPSSNNFSSLVKNILLNDLTIHPFGFAISNTERITSINLVSTIEGDSQHDLSKKNNFYSRNFIFQQGIFETTLDNLIYKYKLSMPNHIKIDVDGNERKILLGAKKLLKSKKLKSMMIEINYKNKNEINTIFKLLNINNFRLKYKSKRIYSNKFIEARNFYFIKN